MNKLEIKITLTFPELYFGEVLGKLSSDGGTAIDVRNDNGIFTLEANLSKTKLAPFKQWFDKATEMLGDINLEK